ncbi:MBL fold metallo-hydrolase [Nocardia sp. NPDC058658]|uniref:MBL fold metallo-hydrolase n=1 Tax=Nocardia sp. NPDC058658 TaxID=3346580 RepID=UPI0036596E62
MRVHHLNFATLNPRGGRLWDGGEHAWYQRATLACHGLLIECATGLVLVDTGLGTRAVTDSQWLGTGWTKVWNPQLDSTTTARAQVVALGYSPDDVRDIIVTHADLDHTGGLADFPAATVHISTDELDALTHPSTLAERNRYRPCQFGHQPRWRAHNADGAAEWRGFTAVREIEGLPAEILMIPLAGHSRGHTGVAVDTGTGWLLHAGDAYYADTQLASPPSCPAGIKVFQILGQADGTRRQANLAALRNLAAEKADPVTIFSSHSHAEFVRHSRRDLHPFGQ